MSNFEQQDMSQTIAIIGMSGRFPGARDVSQFWENIAQQVESITPKSSQAKPASKSDNGQSHFVDVSSGIDNIEMFDASFFGYTPNEAKATDPQHRILLETAYNAFEDAGYVASEFDGLVGAFVGITASSYFHRNIQTNTEQSAKLNAHHILIGNDKSFAATRLAFKMNLTGPAMSVDTACSTSLVAVHQACKSLLTYECDMALSGGACVTVPSEQGYHYQPGGILSPDGHCRPFDAQAQGTVPGNGVGMVVLKRLEDALADGDQVYAVIRGSAVNNDGAVKVGFTAPSVKGQAAVVAEALGAAQVSARSIGYVEAHGTGTRLGDPIEIAALSQVHRAESQDSSYCALSSVKGNIGHLDTAAGIAGLIKAVQALRHKQLPPSLHFTQGNPEIDFASSPFYVNNSLKAWDTQGEPRRAGVSSFGIGGTNAHVILEESPRREVSEAGRAQQLLVLSARSQTALEAQREQLITYLRGSQERLSDIAYTLKVGRENHPYKASWVCHGTAQGAAQQISSEAMSSVLSEGHPERIFMFSGQGSQHRGMGRGLYESEAVFKAALDECADKLQAYLGLDIRAVLFGEDATETQLEQTRLAQPALFAVEYALGKQWIHWGVEPDAMIGHSIGEYVAACFAGVMSLDDALKLVSARGQLMQQAQPGAMLSVSLGESELAAQLADDCSIAAVNGRSLSVAAGPEGSIAALGTKLETQGVSVKRLKTSHAFHSQMMDEVLDAFTDVVRGVTLHPPTRRYISNVTGEWINPEQATSVQYWVEHLRQPVHFARGLDTLCTEQVDRVLIEVGPTNVLCQLAKKHIKVPALITHSAGLSKSTDQDRELITKALGLVWQSGVDVDWHAYYEAEQRQRVSLPGYPFERQRYWIEATETALPTIDAHQQTPISQWFYSQQWHRQPNIQAVSSEAKRVWLLLMDDSGLADALASRLEAHNQRVIRVSQGAAFSVDTQAKAFSLNRKSKQDYVSLASSLEVEGELQVVSLWGIDEVAHSDTSDFCSAVYLAQGLAQCGHKAALHYVGNGVHRVDGNEALQPHKAMILSASKVISQELSGVRSRYLDLGGSSTEAVSYTDVLLQELLSDWHNDDIAFRAKQRWKAEHASLPLSAPSTSHFKAGGVYLITGGLGKIGQVLAAHIAKQGAQVIITSRRAKADTPLSLEGLVDSGSVVIKQADVCDLTQMQTLLAWIKQHYGSLTGVLHAAGTSGLDAYKKLNEVSEEEFIELSKAKVLGAEVLAEVLHNAELDFVLLFSSLSSVLGGFGHSMYAASNQFLDTFAITQSSQSETRWVSVNWDQWQFEEAEYDPAMALLNKFSMSVQQGIDALEYILCDDQATQVIVSTASLASRITRWLKNTLSLSGTEELTPNVEHQQQAMSQVQIESEVRGIWQTVLGVSHIDRNDNFFQLGGDSLLLIQVHRVLKERFCCQLEIIDLFTYCTVEALAEALLEQQPAEQLAPLQRNEVNSDQRIAVIGMSGRFPGAQDVEQFWQNIANHVESITPFSGDLQRSNLVNVTSTIDNIEAFDADLFRFSASEAELTDPQQRVLLETAWHALEDAGYGKANTRKKTGTFVGLSSSSYLLNNLLRQGLVSDPALKMQIRIGNEKDFAASRLAFKLQLTGPAISLNTACSTSLVAVHQACKSLLTYECDMALSGGACVTVPSEQGYHYQPGGILSPDGHCRPFDAQAQGTVPGNGVGMVVLKRLEDALADGDQVYAVIRGSAVNNDGAVKVGFTAPSVKGQAAVVAEALGAAQVSARSIGYVEAHGTGTRLGDPIEIAALSQVHRAESQDSSYCALSSVKGNIGHLDTAAGIAGLIKAVQALRHKQLPPSLHFTQGNPEIDFASSPFYVNNSLKAWDTQGEPRRAGVSSFGIGGTNAHVILEESPRREVSEAGRAQQLLVLSARSQTALEAQREQLITYLRGSQERLSDIAYTLKVGRENHPYKASWVCHGTAQGAAQQISSEAMSSVLSEGHPERIFMFSGQGSQHRGMGRGLYESEAVFKAALDECADKLQAYLGLDIRAVLFGEDATETQLEQTRLAQPALFAVEYALGKQWIHWGVEPDAMIGHSIGEYVAACFAGVMSLDDALKLVSARGQLMQQAQPGAMLSVSLGESELAAQLADDCSIAAVNGRSLSVAAGPEGSIAALGTKLETQGVSVKRLKTSHAFHSQMMDEVLDAFTDVVRGVTLHPPTRRYISNVTGEWINPEQATSVQYWVEHLRQPVHFARGLDTLCTEQVDRVLIEVGPTNVLCQLAKKHIKVPALITHSAGLSKSTDQDRELITKALGLVWQSGVDVDWHAYYEAEQRQRVSLPGYPFERQRYWIEATETALPTIDAHQQTPISQWFYSQQWHRQPNIQAVSSEAKRVWLLLMDDSGLADALASRLEAHNQRVIRVSQGAAFSVDTQAKAFSLNRKSKQDYVSLASSLEVEGELQVVSLWGIDEVAHSDTSDFCSAVYLAQGLAQCGHKAALHYVGNGVHRVDGNEALQPHKAMILSASKVISQELSGVRSRYLDLGGSSTEAVSYTDVLLQELLSDWHNDDIAFRAKQRWKAEHASLPLSAPSTSHFKAGGVYLITGGLGKIGQVLAAHIAKQGAQVIITSRRAKADTPLSLEGLVDSGSVVIKQADVCDLTQMQTLLAWIKQHYGSLTGVLHAAGQTGEQVAVTAEKFVGEDGVSHDPKIQGTLNLYTLFEQETVDFVALFSSISVHVGGPGYLKYAAANQYMSNFALWANSRGQEHWLSIEWDTWLTSQDQEIKRLSRSIPVMEAHEACAALDWALQVKQLGQVIVSVADLAKRIKAATLAPQARPTKPSPSTRRIGLPAYVPPSNESEKTVASVWQTYFADCEIGIHDSFFELGGDSLMALRICSELSERLELDIHVTQMIEHPTVQALSEALDLNIKEPSQSKGQHELSVEQNDDLEDQIAELTDEEVQAMLDEMMTNG
ncbi:SDR family NAD(P)-dependent oxidoreductase [Pseudoalteromonas sp. MMG013]|uniref:type I polyketide synthase n=1 Tax=Pseudoalteromonas sp. MMG013 TaxID=2822687 RepID=UPI001B35EF9F|nr:type I polyketide synthase [Pseudoalteromonas sp. MMG013]MBQ4864760.1 SDR family NAD(P)-dependent oxidoreductase [Pseudoalteromonas sp. MMG013]